MKKPIALLALLLTLTCGLRAQWLTVPSGTYLNLHDIWFPDATHAWIGADSSTLLHSTDAGATWSPVKLAIPLDPPIVAVEFLDANNGFALPYFGDAWVTTDGGATWAESIEFGADACYGTQMAFGDSAQYFLQMGCFTANGIFTRTPISMEYEFLSGSPGFDITDILQDIAWISDDEAIAMGDNNIVYRTSDRGDSWTQLFAKDTLLDWKAVTFASATEGWAVNGDFMEPLYHTVDGGLTWSPAFWMATFFYPEHRSVGFSNGHVFAGGDIDWATGGLISTLRVSDSLFSYQDVAHPVNAFRFPSPDIGFAVGDSGMILRLDSILLSQTQPQSALDEELILFPNPSSGQVAVEWPASWKADVQICVMDMSGRQVLQLEATGQHQQFSVESLPAGMYMVKCSDTERTLTKRLVVQGR